MACSKSVQFGSAVTLEAVDADGKDMSLENFHVDYWKPSNQTNVRSGVVADDHIQTQPGSPVVLINIDAGTLDELSTTTNKWRYMITEDSTEIPWEKPMRISVTQRGK
jgi:hypothetical protein